MGDRLRVSVGIMGVIKKKSTEEFSCFPYILALLKCYLYTWYGVPVVSYKWENLTLITINGLGILLELSFIFIFYWFASATGKDAEEGSNVNDSSYRVTATFCTIAVISAVVFHDHHHRKIFIGSTGLVASVAMYGSPLVVVKQVLQTKSVELMPFYLSFFSFLASWLWLAYGLLSHDLLLAFPNLFGFPLGWFLQLVLYFKYRKRGIMEEPQRWDVEKG